MSAILSAVLPSHSSGILPALPPFSSISFAASMITWGSFPTIVFVPSVTVIGRSVFSLSVRQGIPNAVVSS